MNPNGQKPMRLPCKEFQQASGAFNVWISRQMIPETNKVLTETT